MGETDIAIIDATYDHILQLHNDIRKEDIDEIWASSRMSPLECLEYGLNNGVTTKALLINNKPICIWGVVTCHDLETVGVPWMLGSKELEKYALSFIRVCQEQLFEILNKYMMLTNFVDVRNKKSIKWLKWLGFDFLPPEKYGFDGELFQRFYMRRY